MAFAFLQFYSGFFFLVSPPSKVLNGQYVDVLCDDSVFFLFFFALSALSSVFKISSVLLLFGICADPLAKDCQVLYRI